jgi:hypothetical protein
MNLVNQGGVRELFEYDESEPGDFDFSCGQINCSGLCHEILIYRVIE